MFDEPLVFSKDDGCCKTTMRWFNILASEILSTPSFSSLEKGKKRNIIYAPSIKSSLSSFSIMKLSTRLSLLEQSSIYVFHNSVNKILMLGIIGDSKLAHSINHSKTSLHIIILDDKLYVIGGLKYTLPANYCFMEFFYPNIGTWEPLPNPPFHCQPSEMVTTLFENRKKKSLLLPLIVLFFIPTMSMIIHSQTLILLCPRSYLRVFFLPFDLVKSVGIGNMLYRVSF